jgi:hypothetical protein
MIELKLKGNHRTWLEAIQLHLTLSEVTVRKCELGNVAKPRAWGRFEIIIIFFDVPRRNAESTYSWHCGILSKKHFPSFENWKTFFANGTASWITVKSIACSIPSWLAFYNHLKPILMNTRKTLVMTLLIKWLCL